MGKNRKNKSIFKGDVKRTEDLTAEEIMYLKKTFGGCTEYRPYAFLADKMTRDAYNAKHGLDNKKPEKDNIDKTG